MTWLTWRQLRAQALVVVLAVLVAAGALFVTGRRLHELASSGAAVYDLLRPSDHSLWLAGVVVVAVVPGLVGLFWGAPMAARELETRTHLLVWNQGVTRRRWLATKLGFTAGLTVVVVGALTAVVTWWAEPVDGSTSRTQGGLPGRLTPITFAMRGIVPIGYAVFALVLGLTVGLVLRRTLPAMAVTLALFALVQVAVPLWVRPHLAQPVHEIVAVTSRPVDSISLDRPGGAVTIGLAGGPGDWILVNRTVGRDGSPAALPAWFSTCTNDSVSPGVAVRAKTDGCLKRLGEQGYRQEMVTVPAGRFWSLQALETAMYLAVSVLLAGACSWWLRRRQG